MYFVKVIEDLAEEDRTFYYGKLGNFSITGFEMTISRDASSFIFSLYLPTGFLIVDIWFKENFIFTQLFVFWSV